MTGISRRNLLKGAAFSAAGVAALGLAGCAPQTEATKADAALAETGETAKHTWEVKPEPIAADQISQTVDTEVLVIGGGYSGSCCALLSAAENGATSWRRTPCSTAMAWAAPAPSPRAPWTTWAEVRQIPGDGALGLHLRQPLPRVARGQVVPRVRALHELVPRHGRGQRRQDGHRGLQLHGAPRSPATTSCPAAPSSKSTPWPTSSSTCSRPRPWPAHRLRDARCAAGADESGKVTGAICQNKSGEYVQYNASKGVVLATGDISYNDEYIDAFAPVANRVFTRLCSDQATWAMATTWRRGPAALPGTLADHDASQAAANGAKCSPWAPTPRAPRDRLYHFMSGGPIFEEHTMADFVEYMFPRP